jgi:peptidylprolyl isomerase
MVLQLTAAIFCPWLDGKHTIFGHVVDKGNDVKLWLSKTITWIQLFEKRAAKKFNAVKHSTIISVESENQNKTGFRRAKQKKLREI